MVSYMYIGIGAVAVLFLVILLYLLFKDGDLIPFVPQSLFAQTFGRWEKGRTRLRMMSEYDDEIYAEGIKVKDPTGDKGDNVFVMWDTEWDTWVVRGTGRPLGEEKSFKSLKGVNSHLKNEYKIKVSETDNRSFLKMQKEIIDNKTGNMTDRQEQKFDREYKDIQYGADAPHDPEDEY